MMDTRNHWCDCIRGYAILLVCFAHLLYVPPITAKLGFLRHYFKGDTGVFMFYVLSGFLVTAILTRETTKESVITAGSIRRQRCRAIGHFFARRLFRLQPGLFLFLGFYLTLPRRQDALPLWTLLLPISNLFAGPYITWHLKTLHIEESYYLLIGGAALLACSLKKILWVVVIGVPVGRVCLFFLTKTHPAVAWWLDRCPPLESFAVGGLLTLNLSNLRASTLWRYLLKRPGLLFVVSLVLLTLSAALREVKPFSYVLMLSWPLLFSLLSACMIVSGLDAKQFGPGPGWMRRIGLISYTVYLFQQLPLGPWEEIYGTPFRLSLWLAVLSSVIIGVPLWYRYVEMPLTNLGATIFPRVTPGKAPVDRTSAGVGGRSSPGLPPVI